MFIHSPYLVLQSFCFSCELTLLITTSLSRLLPLCFFSCRVFVSYTENIRETVFDIGSEEKYFADNIFFLIFRRALEEDELEKSFHRDYRWDFFLRCSARLLGTYDWVKSVEKHKLLKERREGKKKPVKIVNGALWKCALRPRAQFEILIKFKFIFMGKG